MKSPQNQSYTIEQKVKGSIFMISQSTSTCQEIGYKLVDKDDRGRDRQWGLRKKSAMLLADIMDYAEMPKKAAALRGCSTYLEFAVTEEGLKLHQANFCRERLCPMCAWRRSRKIYGHMSRIMAEISASGRNIQYVMLTLTCRSVQGAELRAALDAMVKGWDRLCKRKRIKSAVAGWYRGIEITRDTDELITAARYAAGKSYYKSRGLSVGDKNPNFGLYHPHIHCLLAVEPSYFAGKSYIKQSDWVDLWQAALGADYSPVVDVRRVRGQTARAAAEVAKYAAKPGDYISPDDVDLSADTVRTLDAALKGRRLVAYGGLLRDIHKMLNLDDEETGDLVQTDADAAETDSILTVTYIFNTGYNDYYLMGF